jgi:hypothetical protein
MWKIASWGVFSVMRICTRTRIWPVCVVPAKNNFIGESTIYNVKRDKRTRDAGRCAGRYMGAEIVGMRERAYHFSTHLQLQFQGARTVL